MIWYVVFLPRVCGFSHQIPSRKFTYITLEKMLLNITINSIYSGFFHWEHRDLNHSFLSTFTTKKSCWTVKPVPCIFPGASWMIFHLDSSGFHPRSPTPQSLRDWRMRSLWSLPRQSECHRNRRDMARVGPVIGTDYPLEQMFTLSPDLYGKTENSLCLMGHFPVCKL